ncbi:MAG TPA: hypothetical protein DIT04_14105 [Dysgonomonas sp.]|nr:hypothetical protein [Dysgonomonas sp.]
MIQNQKQSVLKQLLPHVFAIACFLAVSLIYFSPQLDGKVLAQSDSQQYTGMSEELRTYYNNEGLSSAWTGAMFSGMPSYSIGVWGTSPNFLDYLEMPVKALGGSTAGPVFTGMLMAYILFCLMGMGFIPSILGAIAYSLSSYNIIILDAGHITKAWVIAYMPLIVAGLAAAFRKKYILAGLLMALGLALQIKNNHLQMTYYTGIMCVFIYAGLIINDVLKKDISGLLKSTAALAVGVIIAVLSNLGNIYSNYEMSLESTRGKSELTQNVQSGEDQKQSSGLDKDYAFAWSYGKSETLSLLVPNIKGGISKGYDENSEVYRNLIGLIQSGKVSNQDANQLYMRSTQYWGDQPFTSGPVYFGAIICFLFVLGMFVIRNRMKWILLAATVFFILLSWGNNLEWFNDWFFYHFPLYNKFRAVSSALVIPALTMVIVAVWGIKEFLSADIDRKKLQNYLFISFGITGGLCLLLWLAPGIFFNFTAPGDSMRGLNIINEYYQVILSERRDLLTSDAFRSFMFILLSAAVLFATLKIKGDKQKTALFASVVIVLLVTVDLWNIDRRYLSRDDFQPKSAYNPDRPFPQTNADKFILEDKDISYRVLNLNNPFEESRTSYFHKSIGGYNAAKLKRYQELIDYELADELRNIVNSFGTQNIDSIVSAFEQNNSLNMLNARYIIFDPQQQPLINPYAMGNAWFVEKYTFVDNADEEIAALKRIDPLTEVVIDKRFANVIDGVSIVPDSTASIELLEYKPNYLKYKSSAQNQQLAVFSEIYYDKGWEAYVDGELVPHVRADWTLRAMPVPAGEHEIEFRFIPRNYNLATTITTASSGLLVLMFIGSIVLFFFRKRE